MTISSYIPMFKAYIPMFKAYKANERVVSLKLDAAVCCGLCVRLIRLLYCDLMIPFSCNCIEVTISQCSTSVYITQKIFLKCCCSFSVSDFDDLAGHWQHRAIRSRQSAVATLLHQEWPAHGCTSCSPWCLPPNALLCWRKSLSCAMSLTCGLHSAWSITSRYFSKVKPHLACI